MRIKVLVWTVFFALSLTAHALSQNDALVQELYVTSGMHKQLEQLGPTIQATFDRVPLEDEHTQHLPETMRSTMKALVLEAFAPAILKETLIAELRENLTTGDMREVLKWLDSPVGKRCTQLEEAASTPQAVAEMEQYAAQMQDSPPASERLAILRNLDAALDATGSSVDIALGAQSAVTLAIIATFPVEQQISPEAVAREMEQSRPQIEALVRQQVLVAMLYTYRSLTDAELKEYIEFAATPVGSKYHSVSMAAFKKAMLGGSIRWGKAIGDAMKQVQGQSNA